MLNRTQAGHGGASEIIYNPTPSPAPSPVVVENQGQINEIYPHHGQTSHYISRGDYFDGSSITRGVNPQEFREFTSRKPSILDSFKATLGGIFGYKERIGHHVRGKKMEKTSEIYVADQNGIVGRESAKRNDHRLLQRQRRQEAPTLDRYSFDALAGYAKASKNIEDAKKYAGDVDGALPVVGAVLDGAEVAGKTIPGSSIFPGVDSLNNAVGIGAVLHDELAEGGSTNLNRTMYKIGEAFVLGTIGTLGKTAAKAGELGQTAATTGLAILNSGVSWVASLFGGSDSEEKKG